MSMREEDVLNEVVMLCFSFQDEVLQPRREARMASGVPLALTHGQLRQHMERILSLVSNISTDPESRV